MDKYSIPNEISEDDALMFSLNKFVRNIFKCVNRGVNPYYKIVEILQRSKDADQMSYFDLQAIDEYYDLHIKDYLMQGNRSMYYLGALCNSSKELKASLSPRNNSTNGSTLRNILVNMY